MTDSFVEETVSAARAARKEAAKLVEELRDALYYLESHLHGKSGLSAEGKVQTLTDAHRAASEVAVKAQGIVETVQKSLDAATQASAS